MKKIVIGFILFALLASSIYIFLSRSKQDVAASEPPQEETLPPVEAASEVVAEAKVVPVRSAALSLPSGGIVAELLVEEGESVQGGQPLLRLQSARQKAAVAEAEARLSSARARLAELQAGAREPEIEAARAALDAARARLTQLEQGAQAVEIRAAEADLAAAQAALAQSQEGPQESQLIAARAELANAEAALQQAQAAYDQVKWREDIGALPQSLQLQQATNNYNAARARYDELNKGNSEASILEARARVQQAEAQLNKLRAPARPGEIEAAQAEIRRAQAQLDLLEAGPRQEAVAAAEADVAAAEAAVALAEVALAEMELRAPFAGTVARLDTRVGEQVGPGAPIAHLADLSSWQIETEDLTELQVVRIEEGDEVTISIDALPELELSGHVLHIKSIGENRQGDIVYTVLIAPERQHEQLRWNMTASVTIDADNQ